MTGVPALGATTRVTHPAWVEVDMDALVSNAHILRGVVPPVSRMGLVVKANGYGHGLVMAARAAVAGGADQLVVASLGEALALRAAGITAPVVVVYPIVPTEVGDAVEAGIELSVSGLESAKQLTSAWADLAHKPEKTLRVHVEVDSGLARGGAQPASTVEVFEVLERPGVAIVGLWSHLADGSSRERTARQVHQFESAASALRSTGRQVPARHVAATDGVIVATCPPYEMVRIGLAFYGEIALGVQPAPVHATALAGIRAAMTVKARAVHLEVIPEGESVGYGGDWTAERPTKIATLPIGYSDGWSRLNWPTGSVLVKGQRAPLVGRLSMDAMCVDVTDIPGVTLEDEFVLLGRQGTQQITGHELAQIRGSIVNEVITPLGPRLPRVYLASSIEITDEGARMAPASPPDGGTTGTFA